MNSKNGGFEKMGTISSVAAASLISRQTSLMNLLSWIYEKKFEAQWFTASIAIQERIRAKEWTTIGAVVKEYGFEWPTYET
jgi:hypothetical protein